MQAAPCAYLSPWLLHSLFPAFHHLPNGEAGRSPPQAGIHLPSLTLLQAIKLRLQDRGGEKNENSAERAVEGKWDPFRTGPIDKSGQEEMASSSEKWRAPQTARPGERTSSRRRRPGWEACSAEGWAVWETGHGCPVSMRNFAVLPTRLGSSPPQALQEYRSRQPSPIIDSGF